jgi:hypothetical protein
MAGPGLADGDEDGLEEESLAWRARSVRKAMN